MKLLVETSAPLWVGIQNLFGPGTVFFVFGRSRSRRSRSRVDDGRRPPYERVPMGARKPRRFFELCLLGSGLRGLLIAGATTACSDSGEADTMGPPAVTVGSGSTADSTSGSGSSSTGTGMGGMGGGGPCAMGMPAASYFTVQTTDLCVVARYDAPALDLTAAYASPTWGNHGGPLTASTMQTGANADLKIARWTLSGTTLSKMESTVALSGLTNPAFFTGEIVDLPSNTSVIGWQGTDFANDGGVFLTTDVASVKSYVATGAFSFAAVGPNVDAYVRVLYTGLSALDQAKNDVPALYAADLHADGSFVVTPAAVATWGDSNGPVAADSAGNVFAIEASFANGNQELRGFAATKIAPLATATPGVTLATIAGFGSELAAVAPKAALPGLVIFQPQMGAGLGQDVVVQRYTSDGTTLAVSGMTEAILQLATAGTNLTLMTDPTGRLWVGAKNVDAGASGTSFFVLDRP